MQAVTLPLDRLPPEGTSFTLVDSCTAMGPGPKFGVAHLPKPDQSQVYRIDELTEVITRHGLPRDDPPADGYEGYERRPVTQFIEVQLWSDDPVAAFLA